MNESDNKAYLNRVDPLKKQEFVSNEDRGDLSPLTPPEADHPPSSVKVPYEQMHGYIRHYMDEHSAIIRILDLFETDLKHLSETKKIDQRLQKNISLFFEIFLNEFIPHNQREEREFFPLLEKCFLEIGEHSNTSKPVTPIDIMYKEHVEALLLAIESQSYWRVLEFLKEESDRTKVLASFLKKSFALIEVMRLHIFREDDVVFSLAQKNLDSIVLDNLFKNL